MPSPTRNRLLFSGQPRTYADKVIAIAPANLVSYLPLSEAVGGDAADLSGHAYNGAYTGVDLGQPGIGDGRTAPLFDGVNDYVNWYSAGLAGAFNGAAGTTAQWVKVTNAGIWADATQRTIVVLQVNTQNRVELVKTTTANQLRFRYTAGNVSKSIQDISLGATTNWFHLVCSWDAAADAVKGYINGVQVGGTQTALGVWAGTLASTAVVIGAASLTPTVVWSGYLAHLALWNVALSGAQIAQLAAV